MTEQEMKDAYNHYVHAIGAADTMPSYGRMSDRHRELWKRVMEMNEDNVAAVAKEIALSSGVPWN